MNDAGPALPPAKMGVRGRAAGRGARGRPGGRRVLHRGAFRRGGRAGGRAARAWRLREGRGKMWCFNGARDRVASARQGSAVAKYRYEGGVGERCGGGAGEEPAATA